jgi:hypothetical protein
MKSTKEQIKNRMIKTAAKVWGVEANEIETSFDPIISLLLAACAAEIEKISSELDESETRITEKLIELMTPERSIGPSLAHAILYAEPIDKLTAINPEYHFTSRKEIPYEKTSVKFKDISFTPIQDFNLVDAKIEHLVTASNHVLFEEKRNRQILGKNFKSGSLPNSTLFLGVSGTVSNLSLNDVSFYFELQSTKESDKELFYNHLGNSRWSLNGNPIEIISGFYNSKHEQELLVTTIFEEVSKKSDIVCQEIINFYKKNFITVKSISSDHLDGYDSKEFDESLKENGIKMDSGIEWIKIEFPTVVSDKILKDVFCSLNAFPVINREMVSFSYRLKDYVHIVPLKTDNLFFDVKSIVNTEGEKYSSKIDLSSNSNKGSFLLRGNNIGSLEQRRAKDYIIYLLELLKDESASFSFLNNDFLLKSLKSLNQQIAALEKKVGNDTMDQSQTHFAVLDPYKANDQLLIEFWTTNGLLANQLKSGTELYLNKGFGVKQNTNYLLTTSNGGKDDLKMSDRLNAYRRSLLSRDRIVTKEDIKALCFEIYGEQLENVAVERGFSKDLDLNKGWTPCVQILLTPRQKSKTKKDLWKHENSKLMYLLKKKSLNVFPYELKIIN